MLVDDEFLFSVSMGTWSDVVIGGGGGGGGNAGGGLKSSEVEKSKSLESPLELREDSVAGELFPVPLKSFFIEGFLFLPELPPEPLPAWSSPKFIVSTK